MSLRIVVEVALHFESFRNVDLFHQGLYHLKTRLYWEEDGQQLLATPHCYFRNPAQGDVLKGKGNRPDHHHLIPAHIIEDQRTFSTRSFLIRYCEEEVELNEIGQFRIEFDPNATDKHGPLTLEVDLMFADLTQHGGPDRFGEQPKDVGATEFKSVSSQYFRLHGMENGIHEFCPVVFDEFHFCLANLAVHSIALDSRFRLRPALQGKPRSGRPPPPPPRALPGADGLGDAAAELPVREGVFSFAEVLLKGADASGDQLLERAEELYQRHVALLAGSHARQREWLGTVRTKCLTPPHRQLLGDAVEAPELLLPEDMPLQQSSSSTSCPGGARKPCKRLGARLGAAAGQKEIAALVAYDMNLISCQILQLWNKALHIMSYACREVTTLLRLSWEQQMCRRWGISIQREIMIDDIGRPKNKCIGDAHTSAAEKLRASLKQAVAETPALAVEDVSLFPLVDDWPCLFEQRYIPRQGPGDARSGIPHLVEEPAPLPSSPKEYKGVHLFVLVHGFQGNSFDMRLMKNNMALLYPDAVFLCSSANEENTEGDFNEMGIRLAQEVVNYICDWCPGSALGQLSFVAHSIGGLIVRCALPLLQEYSSKMYTLLTFSTPHAGYFLKNITLFHLGLRMLQSWRQSTCLSQLSMTDSSDPKDTFLYRLSQTRGLEFFRHVALVSCPSDQYSPFDSARIEVGGMLDMHSHKDVYVSMVRNIWEAVKPERVIRFDVNFNIAEKNLDTFIGRAAHILFLESQHIMRMIIHNYSFLFR